MRVAPLDRSQLAMAELVLADACAFDRATEVAEEKLFGPGPTAPSIAFGAWQDEELVGVAAVSAKWLRVIAVVPRARRKGAGEALLRQCESHARAAGETRMRVLFRVTGGSMFAMSYYGANKVVPNYNVMGPVKAALEACCRYLAYELGGKGIRVHAISPGPLKTRAASGLKDFDLLLNEAAQRAPIGELVDIMDVGFTCAYLATPYARRLSGETLYVDGGVNIMA